ncbi:MAG: hypothetical protein AAFY15_01790 [Cyanobacteria bacterium J06648_11]
MSETQLEALDVEGEPVPDVAVRVGCAKIDIGAIAMYVRTAEEQGRKGAPEASKARREKRMDDDPSPVGADSDLAARVPDAGAAFASSAARIAVERAHQVMAEDVLNRLRAAANLSYKRGPERDAFRQAINDDVANSGLVFKVIDEDVEGGELVRRELYGSKLRFAGTTLMVRVGASDRRLDHPGLTLVKRTEIPPGREKVS